MKVQQFTPGGAWGKVRDDKPVDIIGGEADTGACIMVCGATIVTLTRDDMNAIFDWATTPPRPPVSRG